MTRYTAASLGGRETAGRSEQEEKYEDLQQLAHLTTNSISHLQWNPLINNHPITSHTHTHTHTLLSNPHTSKSETVRAVMRIDRLNERLFGRSVVSCLDYIRQIISLISLRLLIDCPAPPTTTFVPPCRLAPAQPPETTPVIHCQPAATDPGNQKPHYARFISSNYC